MSFLGNLFDSEWLQRQDIDELRQRAARQSRAARRGRIATSRRIQELEDQVAVLELVSQTLIAVLEEAGRLDRDVFLATMQRLDAEDDVVDGRITLAEEQEEPEPPAAPVRRRRRRD